MTAPTVTPLPTPPSRQEPDTFADRSDAFLGALPTFQTELNALGSYVDTTAAEVDADAATASAAADAAVAAAGATEWVSGASYEEGDVVWSPLDYQTYRAKTTHSGIADDPSADSTNWVQISVSNIENNALLNVAQTFTANQTVSAEFLATSYNETFVSLSGTTPTVNCEAGNNFSLSTTGNTTFTFTNPPASGTAYGFTLKVTAGGTHTLTWPASVDWSGGTAPDAPASGETDVFVFFTTDGGTNWYGFQAGDALA